MFRLDEETQYKGLDPLVLVESGRRLERARWHPTNDNIFATVAASDRSVYLYDAQYTQASICLTFLLQFCHKALQAGTAHCHVSSFVLQPGGVFIVWSCRIGPVHWGVLSMFSVTIAICAVPCCRVWFPAAGEACTIP